LFNLSHPTMHISFTRIIMQDLSLPLCWGKISTSVRLIILVISYVLTLVKSMLRFRIQGGSSLNHCARDHLANDALGGLHGYYVIYRATRKCRFERTLNSIDHWISDVSGTSGLQWSFWNKYRDSKGITFHVTWWRYDDVPPWNLQRCDSSVENELHV
jgi:hypothetical protein